MFTSQENKSDSESQIQQNSVGTEESSRKEVEAKQEYYNDEIKLLEKALVSVKLKEPQNVNKFWESIKHLSTFSNSAGEYFVKLGLPDIGFPYFEKASDLMDTIPKEEIKETKEWRTLKIRIIKNISSLYKAKGDLKKMASSLKKIVKHQRSLEREDEVLAGAEFTYIDLADVACKEKNWKELYDYSRYAISVLEKQLGIKRGIPILQNFPATREESMLIIHTKKFITLSYAYNLLGRALLQDRNYVNALGFFEKAYEIAKRYLGETDNITESYKRRIEKVLEKLKVSVPRPQSGYGLQNDSSNLTGFASPVLGQTTQTNAIKESIKDLNTILDKFNSIEDSQPIVVNTQARQTPSHLHKGSLTQFQFYKPEKPLILTKPRPTSIGGLSGLVSPLSQKNLSTTTQLPIESMEKDNIVIFDVKTSKKPVNKSLSNLLSPTHRTLRPQSGGPRMFSSPTNKDFEVSFHEKKPSAATQYNHTRDSSASNLISLANKGKASGVFSSIEKFDQTTTPFPGSKQELDTAQSPDSFIRKDTQSILKPFLSSKGTNSMIMFMNKRPDLSSTNITQSELTVFQSPKGIGKRPTTATVRKPIQNSFFQAQPQINVRPVSAKVRQPSSTNKYLEVPTFGTEPAEPINELQIKSRSPSPILETNQSHDKPENKFFLDIDMMTDWESSGSSLLNIQEKKEAPRVKLQTKERKPKLSKNFAQNLKKEAEQANKVQMEQPGTGLFNDRKRIITSEVTQNETEKASEKEEVEAPKMASLIDMVLQVPKNETAKEKFMRISRDINKKLKKSNKSKAMQELRKKHEAITSIQRQIRKFLEKRREAKEKKNLVNLPTDESEKPNIQKEKIANHFIYQAITKYLTNLDALPHHPSHPEANFLSKFVRDGKNIIFRDTLDVTPGKLKIDDLYRQRDDVMNDYLVRKKYSKEEQENVRKMSFEVDDSFLLPPAGEVDIPQKLDIIKRNLANLKDYEISFYGHFFEMTGLWTVRYDGVVEKAGDLTFVFYLCHGQHYQPFFIKADLGVTEKAMFNSTIWAVISSNLNALFSKDEILYQLNPRIQQDVNKLFLIIKDLKKEAKINPFLRIRQVELDSLREFIIKLCYLLENRYILHKKLNGYIYAEASKIGNSFSRNQK